MKSCCNNCKKGKPCCGSDMGPTTLNGAFRRRSIGYGVYGENPAPVAAEPKPAATPPGIQKKIFGLDPKLAYVLGAVILLKMLV